VTDQVPDQGPGDEPISYRTATRADCALILDFIGQLAKYEHMEKDVVATEELLAEWLFERAGAEVIFALLDGREVGFALFFPNFSTFLGRSGLYLEDLFVLPEYRGCGAGKGLLGELARIAVERGYGRFEWSCLDWNTPSIGFYLALGAQPLEEWTAYRLTGESLRRLASGQGGSQDG